jgi:hypothetical protein
MRSKKTAVRDARIASDSPGGRARGIACSCDLEQDGYS